MVSVPWKPTPLPGFVKAQADLIAWRIAEMGKRWGWQSLLVVTLTTVDPWEWERLTVQFNNLWSKKLKGRYAAYTLVPEYSDNGRLHAHAVFALSSGADVATGYNWAACDAAKRGPKWARFRTGANVALRAEMAYWESGKFDMKTRTYAGAGVQLPYAFGRCRVEPVRDMKALPRYLAKYLTKGYGNRPEVLKGKRLLRNSRNLADIYPPRQGAGVYLWDARLSSFLALNGWTKADLPAKFGPGWYRILADIIWETPVYHFEPVKVVGPDGVDREISAYSVACRGGAALVDPPEGFEYPETIDVTSSDYEGRFRECQWLDVSYKREVSMEWVVARLENGVLKRPPILYVMDDPPEGRTVKGPERSEPSGATGDPF